MEMGLPLFPRTILQKIIQLIENKEEHPSVLLVEGPRQVGKTTLIEQALKDRPHLAINLERELRHTASINQCKDFTEFTNWLGDELNFYPNGSQILFIDEAQESETLGGFVRSMKEEWQNTQVILSGSMMSRFFRDDTRFPVGRVKTIHVQPLSFFEYLAAQSKTEWVELLKAGDFRSISTLRHEALLKALDTYFHIGGLPQVVRETLAGNESRPVLIEIFENYRNDFKRVFGDNQGFLFERALQAVADHVGSPSKFSQAFKPNEADYKKMAATFSRLESWRVIHTSQQRGPLPEGTTQFHPKRYLFDMGLLNLLRTLGVPNLSILNTAHPTHRATLGGIFENWVACYLTSQNQLLAGWKQAPAGIEVDFIARFNEQTIPIECKAALQMKENHLTGLKKYMQEYGLPVAVIVSAAPYEVRNYAFGKIMNVPLYGLGALPVLLKIN